MMEFVTFVPYTKTSREQSLLWQQDRGAESMQETFHQHKQDHVPEKHKTCNVVVPHPFEGPSNQSPNQWTKKQSVAPF